MNLRKKTIKNGDYVKEKVTGMEGVVMAVTDWWNGCKRMAVQPTQLKDGVLVDLQHIDEHQLEIVKKVKEKKSKYKPGGPSKPVGRSADPTR